VLPRIVEAREDPLGVFGGGAVGWGGMEGVLEGLFGGREEGVGGWEGGGGGFGVCGNAGWE